MNIKYFKLDPLISSLSVQTGMKLTQKPTQPRKGFETLGSFISGYAPSEMVNSKSRYLPAMESLKRYIFSNNLSNLPYTKVLIHWLKEDQEKNYPFTDAEILDILGVKNEEIAFQRLIHLIHQTLD